MRVHTRLGWAGLSLTLSLMVQGRHCLLGRAVECNGLGTTYLEAGTCYIYTVIKMLDKHRFCSPSS